MRSIIFIPALIVLCSCSNPTDTKTDAEDSIIAEEPVALPPMNVLFPELFQYFHTQDSSFTSDGFEEGEAKLKSDSLSLKIMDTSQLAEFYPYLLFNADSSYALDLVSYNFEPQKRKGKIIMQEMGPDFEVSIIDMDKKERKRLLFFGPSGASILDAKWVDSVSAVMAGAFDLNNGDSLRPVIWKYNTNDKTLQQFTYNKMIRADWSRYPKKIYELKK